MGPVDDERHMRRAIALAMGAVGWTSPNPLVGAVVVKDGRVIGEGRHERYGQPHAERNALSACTRDPAGATVYVNLEPCSHTGKQPPCADALIEAGVSRVVVGSRDPNPLVSGKGVARLRAAGIRVDEDFLRSECDAINGVFFRYIVSGLPYVVAKWAMTADGKIASHTGDARWVSGEDSRAQVHELRHRLSSVMVGINTVLADDPLLTARRSVPSRQPLRIVCDSKLRLPLDCKLLRSLDTAPLLIACAVDVDDGSAAARRAGSLRDAGAELLSLPSAEGRVDLRALMGWLGARGIDSVLLEGGSSLNWQAFDDGLVDEVRVFLAPKIVGGADAPSPVGGRGLELMADAFALGSPQVDAVDGDVRIVYKLQRSRVCSPA